MSKLKSMYLDYLYIHRKSGNYSACANAHWIMREYGFTWKQSKILQRMFLMRLISN